MVKITGREGVLLRLNHISGPEMVREVGAALLEAGNLIQVEAQLSITNGAVSGKGHVASLPGEPPKNDTDVLADGIETVHVEPLLVEVRSTAPYAAALEYGTVKMAPRPYMKPALEKHREEVVAMVRANVNKLKAKYGGAGGN